MTAIITLHLENADCSHRWLPAGRADACSKGRIEPFVAPRSSSFATTFKLASTLTMPACHPEGRRGFCRCASRASSAPAKST